MFKVKLWFVIRIKPTAESTQYVEHSFVRDITLPFAPMKGVVILEEDEKNPWLFVANTIGYNITHNMFNCEYAVEADNEKYATISNSLIMSGWRAVEEK